MTWAAEWRTTLSAASSFSLRSSRATSSVSGAARSTRRSPASCAAPYMAASSLSLCSSAAETAAESGRTLATTTAAASRGEMLIARSSGVVPRATSRTEPSGNCTRTICAFSTINSLIERFRLYSQSYKHSCFGRRTPTAAATAGRTCLNCGGSIPRSGHSRRRPAAVPSS